MTDQYKQIININHHDPQLLARLHIDPLPDLSEITQMATLRQYFIRNLEATTVLELQRDDLFNRIKELNNMTKDIDRVDNGNGEDDDKNNSGEDENDNSEDENANSDEDDDVNDSSEDSDNDTRPIP